MTKGGIFDWAGKKSDPEKRFVPEEWRSMGNEEESPKCVSSCSVVFSSLPSFFANAGIQHVLISA
jgi:hypothetical protein